MNTNTRIFKITLLSMALLACSTGLFAQLSGNHVIGASAGADYATFNEAYNGMVSEGVSGEITFFVESGVYNEQLFLDLTAVTFTTSSPAISFVGQGTDPSDVLFIFTSLSDANDYVLRVSGGSNLTFENIKFQNTGNPYANVISIGSPELTDNVTFDNCITESISGTTFTNFPTGIFFSEGSTGVNVFNCEITGGQYGITCFGGVEDVEIIGNQLTNQKELPLSMGVEGAIIQRNTIVNEVDNLFATYGIEVWSAEDVVVDANILNMKSGSKGIWMNNVSVSALEKNVVSNNYVNIENSLGIASAIEIGGSDVNVFHNTAISDTQLGVIQMTSAFAGITLVNNILINVGEGSIYLPIVSSAASADYNLLYTEGLIQSNAASFTEHQQLGFDEHSHFFDVPFPFEDLPNICHYAVADLGTPVDITTDVYGTSRSSTTPDIGAYEFELPETVVFATDSVDICLGTTEIITVANPFEEYLWLVDSSTNTTLEVDSTNNYIVEVTDLEGCVLSDTQYVATQFVDVELAPDTTICMGSSLDIYAGEGFASYLWSTGETTDTINVSTEEMFKVQVTNELGCMDEDSIMITLADDFFEPNFLVSGVGCTADTIQFLEVSDVEPDTVSWAFGDGGASMERHPGYLYGSVGDYTVTMSAELGECILKKQKEVVITSTCADYLVAYYPLDTGANDISDNMFDGELMGDLTFVEDEERGAVAFFDGVDDYIALTTSQALDLYQSSFTISSWVKLTSVEGIQPVVGTDTDSTNQGLILGLNEGQAFQSFLNNDLTGKQSITEDEWHFVTYSYDVDSETMTIYVDGEQDGTATGKAAFEGLAIVNIGLTQSDTYFAGYLDDLRIWREVLTDEEIFENFSGYNTSLVSYYPLTADGSDLSGNGFDGTVNGTVEFVSDSERGLVASFDDRTDYIRLFGADEQSITESSFMVSAWVKPTAFPRNDMTILGTETRSGTRSGLHLLSRQTNPHMGFWGNDTRDRTTSLQADEWYHIRFVYDRTELTQRIYVNGKLTAQGFNKRTYIGTQTLLIGKSINNNKGWNGYISDLKIRRIEDGSASGRQMEELVSEETVRELNMYPNPSGGIVNLAIDNEENWAANIAIYTIEGTLVYDTELSGFGPIQERLDLTGLESGMYFLKMVVGEESFTKRLLIRSY